MIHFKSRNIVEGVTFIEVALTLFMVSSILSSLLVLDSSIITSIYTLSNRMNRILLIKQVLFKAFVNRQINSKEKFPEKTTIEDPATTITYELKKPSKESSLKEFSTIMIEKVTAEWEEFNSKQRETMISLVYKPEQKK